MTPEEIWSYADEHGHSARVGTKGKTPSRTMGARIYVEIRDNPSTPFVKHGTRPTRFSLKTLVGVPLGPEPTSSEATVQSTKAETYYERELHAFLSYFAYTYWGVWTKTIFHEKSTKRSYGEWLHPDLVGVRFPIGELSSEVLDLGLTLGGQLVTLYSFEMKKELNFTNLRESFFQAVSNSSWANEGYLVAADISNNDEFLDELKRLSASFGIGIIRLNVESPDDSYVLFPANRTANLDGDTIDKLARSNPDFRDFLVRVRNDMNIREITPEKYDKVIEVDELVEKLKGKHADG